MTKSSAGEILKATSIAMLLGCFLGFQLRDHLITGSADCKPVRICKIGNQKIGKQIFL